MAVVPMASLSMVGPKDEVLGVARRLLLRGCFQPVPIDSVVDDREMRSALDTSGENPWEGLLAEMESLWETAGERPPLPDPARSGDLPSYEEIRGRVAALTEKLSAWERRRRELTAEVEQLEAARIFAEALEEAHIPLEAAAGGGILGIYTGSVTREDYDRLEDISAEVPLLVVPLARPGGHVWVMALTVSGYAEGAEQLLDSVSFRRFALGELLGGMGKDWRGEIQRRLDHHGRAIEGLAGAAEGYLERNRAGLERLYGQIYCMERVQEVCRRRGEMDDLYVVSGWLPADETEEVERMVDAEAPGTVIIAGSRPRTGGSRVPVFLRNLPGVRFFQDIVALYSTPAYTESDPSFFVAVTFCLFFGFMFGDIAHGLMLVAAAVLLRKTGILSRAFGAVLTLAGLSSTLFGVLYGSVFGDEHLIPGLWLSPMEDMGLLIQSALLLGIGVISAGMVMNILLRYRRGEWGRLLFDIRGVAGLLLYWLAVVLAWAGLSGRGAPFPPALSALLVALLLSAILFSGPLTRRLFRQEGEGEGVVVHLFHVFHGLLSFLSNTVSFVRLAAFALNHVGLSVAVLMLSTMVEGIPGGGVLAWVILVAGHLVIVALEGLIVFIQALRLEYYELFSKFYSGGGTPFAPVRWGGGRG